MLGDVDFSQFKILNKMNKYQKILNLFVSTDEMRNWMQRPFAINSKIYATNGYALVAFNITNLKELIDFATYNEDKLTGIYPLEHNLDNTYTVDFLKECFKKVPLVEDFDEEEKEDICIECDGSGDVEFEYDSKSLKTYYKECECPICEGDGRCIQTVEKPNGKMVEDFNSKCVIGNSLFFANKVKRIIEVADLLGVSEFKHVHQTTPSKQSLFKIGDVDLLLMPTMSNGDFHSDGVAFNIA